MNMIGVRTAQKRKLKGTHEEAPAEKLGFSLRGAETLKDEILDPGVSLIPALAMELTLEQKQKT